MKNNEIYQNYTFLIDDHSIEAHSNKFGHRWCATDKIIHRDGKISFWVETKENVPRKIIDEVIRLGKERGWMFSNNCGVIYK